MKIKMINPDATFSRGRRRAAGKFALLLALFCAAPAFAQRTAALPPFEISSGTPLLTQSAATAAVVGQGGNYTLPLPDGGVLWLLNNVWLGEVKDDGQAAVWGIVDGAAAISQSTAPEAQRGALGYIKDENGWPLPLLSAEMKEYSQARKFRPRAGVTAGGRYYFIYTVLNNYGPELYDYFRVGQGVARAEKPGGPYQKARSAAGYCLWDDIEPAFGSAAWADEDGWIYVYGRAMNAPGEYGAVLARVKPEDLSSREKYSYYSLEVPAGSWTEDVSEASPVLDNAPEEFSVSYNDFLKSYLAVYTDAVSGGVLARTASYPWGPWSDPQRLLACKKEEYCDGAKEHAVFAARKGQTVYLTLEKKNVPYLYEINFK